MKIFISWSKNLAKWAASDFTKWSRQAFRSSQVKFFFSDNDIRPGLQWRKILGNVLRDYSIGVFFMTRESMNEHWVLFEGGAIGKLNRSRVFCVLLGVTDGEIPSPFRQYQATPMEKEKFWSMIDSIAKMAQRRGASISASQLRQSFDSWWPGFDRTVRKKLGKSLSGKGDWKLVSAASIASRIGGSPFEAKNLFEVAKHRLDFIAQNHYFMTVDHQETHLDLLRSFLNKKGKCVRILAMDNRKKGAANAWKELMGTKDFPRDLTRSIRVLRKWKNIASSENWNGTLEIRLTNLVATSQNFIDGGQQDKEGKLVITPMGRKPSNIDRPVMYLSRKNNKDAFDVYWSMYLEQWRRARKI